MTIDRVRPGDVTHGFEVREVADLPEIRGRGALMEHRRSGARLVVIDAGDEERLFGAGFRTPPPNDTGLPHILEHTVLCGSRRYPVKDPFVEMLKCSLATFLNAITWPDRTIYPCASMNERDFRNLMAVYCDAVFHPLLREEHFRQEGHHLDVAEPGNPASPLRVNGIVFSEMKGVYSTLDGVLDRAATANLFPDTPAGRDSGGTPEAMPSLTYEQFVEFHRRYYHPSNAFLFLYVPGDPSPHLAFLDREVLAPFDRREIDTTIPLQPRWREPRRVTVAYPALPSDTPDRKSAYAIEWLLNPSDDADATIAMSVLAEYLGAHSGSPLRRALLESRLGEEAIMSYSNARRECAFSVGLYGCDAARTADIDRLVFETLRAEVSRGFDRRQVESAFHQFELASRHVPEMFPLLLMDRVFSSWLYGASPWTWIRIGDRLRTVSERMAASPRFLEEQARRWLLDNPHRVHVTVVPDPDESRRREAAWAERMAATRGGMSDADVARIDREARELERRQARPNPPEALATLPRLSRADVPAEPPRLAVEAVPGGEGRLLRVDVLTRGVVYLRIAIDLSDIEEGWWPLLPALAAVWMRTGAAGADYATMAQREAAACAGFALSVAAGGRVDDALTPRPALHIWTHALDSRVETMLAVLRDRLLAPDFSDYARLTTILTERQAGLREDVVPSASSYAISRAGRHLSRNGSQAEAFAGVAQVRAAVRLAERARREPAAVADELDTLRRRVLAGADWLAAVAGGEEPVRRVADWWGEVVAGRAGAETAPPPDAPPAGGSRAEGIAVPADVAYAGVALPAPPADHPDAAPLRVLAHRLSLDFLWNEIRVKQGAYGARASYNSTLGEVTLMSYRDPKVAATLSIFRRIPDHVAAQMDMSPAALETAIIGAMRGLDPPMRPASALATALERARSGATDAFRRRLRARLLAVSADDLRRVSEEVLRPGLDDAPVCVIGGRPTLEALALPGWTVENLLPNGLAENAPEA